MRSGSGATPADAGARSRSRGSVRSRVTAAPSAVGSRWGAAAASLDHAAPLRGKVVRSPASGDDVARIGQLEDECDIPMILDGEKLGDREYALRRFSPRVPDAKSRKQVLSELIEAASQMSTSNLHMLRDRREMKQINLQKFKKAKVDFQRCPKWCFAWVAEELMTTITAPDIWDMIDPHIDGDLIFDPAAPKLATIYVPDFEALLSTAKDHALNYLLLPLVQSGSTALDVIQELRVILRDRVKDSNNVKDGVL
eukprot:9140190-Pyramimonas_sp.AAC.1